MPRPSVRIGIIGTGYGRRVLAPAFARIPGCRVLEIGGSVDARRIVSDPRLDVIALAVPPVHQPELAREALRRGKRVFCEKPLAADVRGAEAIRRAARGPRGRCAVDFEFTEMPAWKKARELLRAGALGRFSHALINWQIQTYAFAHGIRGWKSERRSGGGALHQFASHSFHTLEWFFGPARRLLAALDASDTDTWKGSVGIRALIEFSKGTATLALHTDSPHGTGQHFEIYGERGGLLVYSPDPSDSLRFALMKKLRGDRVFTPVTLESAPAGEDARLGPVARLAANWLSGKKAPGLDEGVRVQRLLDAAERSHRAGKWVRV